MVSSQAYHAPKLTIKNTVDNKYKTDKNVAPVNPNVEVGGGPILEPHGDMLPVTNMVTKGFTYS